MQNIKQILLTVTKDKKEEELAEEELAKKTEECYKNVTVTVENQTIVGRHYKALRLVRGEDVWKRTTATTLTST